MVSAAWLQGFNINSLINTGLDLNLAPNSSLLSLLFCGQMHSARYWIMRDRFIVNIWNLVGGSFSWSPAALRCFDEEYLVFDRLYLLGKIFSRGFLHIPTIILGLHQEVVSDCPQALDIKKPIAWTGRMMGSSYIAYFGALHSAELQTGWRYMPLDFTRN